MHSNNMPRPTRMECGRKIVAITFLCYSISLAQEVLKDTDPGELLFKRLFKQRRLEQLEAVKGLLMIDSYEKQYKMVNVIAEKVFNVIQTSRAILESSGYIPGSSTFPKDESILDALANILENTALFGDIVLRLPDVSQRVLASRHEWEVLLHWSLGFSNQTQLLDKPTATLVSLVAQELNITERHATYINPYRKYNKPPSSEQKTEEDGKSETKKKKKKDLKKGPRMSSGGYRKEL